MSAAALQPAFGVMESADGWINRETALVFAQLADDPAWRALARAEAQRRARGPSAGDTGEDGLLSLARNCLRDHAFRGQAIEAFLDRVDWQDIAVAFRAEEA